NVGPTDGRKALETELTQLKDTITALKIQNDRFKVTNATQKTKITKLKAKDVDNKSSGTTTPTNPKILDPMEEPLELSSSVSSSSNVTMLSREHSKVLELEAKVLKRQHMLTESEKRCAFLKNEHVNLQLKFQKYKECLQSQKHCDSSHYTASNAIFEINKLKDQLQGKDKMIRNLQARHDIVSLLNVGPTDGRKALETELTQLKDTITALKIQNDRFKVTNATQKTKITKLKAKDVDNKSSGTTTPTNPKYLIRECTP
nr:hypothetical protein [Tanacetum cinerariifolium]